MDAVSSSITIGALAANIAKNVVKLKACWEAIQDAPQDVHFLVKRLELLSLILHDIQDDQTQNPVSSLLFDGSTASTCIETCKVAADRLGQLADNMATSIESSRQLKRKWASLRVVMKKNRIERFEAELQSCIALLQLSHETYTRALLRLQPDIIHARIMQVLSFGTHPTLVTLQDQQIDSPTATSSSLASISRPQPSDSQSYCSFWQSLGPFNVLGSLRISRRCYQKRNVKDSDSFQDIETRQEIRAWYRGPAWLVNRAWAFHAVKVYSGWDCYFRQYNIIPWNSPVFEHARTGNLAGLRGLFDKNQASPWDTCKENGYTPLHYAVLYTQFFACELLLQLGADNNHRNNVGSSPAELAIESHFPTDLVDMSRLLTKKAEVEPDFLRFYHGSEEVFILWQQSLDPQYYEIPLKERVEVAIGLSWEHFSNGPAVFRRALTMDHIPRLAVSMRDGKGRTLLHAVALRIGEVVQYISIHPLSKSKGDEEDLAGWRSILREIICEGADLHSIDSASHTPFMSLLKGISHSPAEDGVYPRVEILDTWLGDLRDCGVDLYEYGRREEGVYRNSSASREFESWERFPCPRIWKLVSFTYGSSPRDWHLRMEWRHKKRNQHHEQVHEIPGSWVED